MTFILLIPVLHWPQGPAGRVIRAINVINCDRTGPNNHLLCDSPQLHRSIMSNPPPFSIQLQDFYEALACTASC